MQPTWLPAALTALFGFLLIAFLISALAKARRRRREELYGSETRGEWSVSREAEEAEDTDDRRALRAAAVVDAAAKPDVLAEDESELSQSVRGGEESARLPLGSPEGADEESERAAADAAEAEAAMRRGLEKTHTSFFGKLNQLFARTTRVDATVLEELEDVLLMADVGVKLSTRLIDELRGEVKAGRLDSAASVREALRERMLAAVLQGDKGHDPLDAASTGRKPYVILFVGVNGVGKTTTIGKIAQKLTARGMSVVMAAGDTFRAAAAEQLGIWGERTGSRVIRGEEGSDPASVVYNAVVHAEQSGADVVLADTAGRLHTKTELMDEIKKVQRAADKARASAPDETWLVVDATTGQNALQQAREFNATLGLSGLVLTKLDGTAKGGVVINIVDDLKIPVQYVGVGEKADDLRPFNGQSFISALFAN